MDILSEKAIIFLLGLTLSLTTAFYKLFKSSFKESVQKDFDLLKNSVQKDLVILETKLEAKMDKKIEEVKKEIQSLKLHENNNYRNQDSLLNKVLNKLNKLDQKKIGNIFEDE